LNILNIKAIIEKVPVLGTCLGMQLLTNSSEEWVQAGLKWIDAEILAFKGRVPENFNIPLMSWNFVDFQNNNKIL
jgi:glutamine amidotransferase